VVDIFLIFSHVDGHLAGGICQQRTQTAMGELK